MSVIKIEPSTTSTKFVKSTSKFYLRVGTPNYNFSYNEVLPEANSLKEFMINHPDDTFHMEISQFPRSAQMAMAFTIFSAKNIKGV